MNIKLQRTFTSQELGGYTFGEMYFDGSTVRECYTLEDEKRAVKVHGETRIPAGRYRVEFRKVLTGKTEKYRHQFPWFSWHLWLQDVPGFQYVYIHVGNTDDDTDGCILVGFGIDKAGGKISSSRPAFEQIYKKIAACLNNQDEVWIEIVDEK
jgi:hypothetical protein